MKRVPAIAAEQHVILAPLGTTAGDELRAQLEQAPQVDPERHCIVRAVPVSAVHALNAKTINMKVNGGRRGSNDSIPHAVKYTAHKTG